MILRYYHKLKPSARKLRNSSTLSETILWKQIKGKRLGYNFYRQKPIANYIVDFYCPALKLVLEIDGSSHESKQDYDKFRDEFFHIMGLEVVHFLDKDVKNNLDGIMNFLKDKISLIDGSLSQSRGFPL